MPLGGIFNRSFLTYNVFVSCTDMDVAGEMKQENGHATMAEYTNMGWQDGAGERVKVHRGQRSSAGVSGQWSGKVLRQA